MYVVLGTLILWLGWVMFNGGSSLAIVGDDGMAAQRAIINTILSPSAAGIVTFFIKNKVSGQNLHVRFDFSGLTNGILAGLVAITAACAAVQPWAAVVIGIISSFVYCLAVRMMTALKIDDPLEAFHVHGCCGLFGVIAVAIFDQENGIIAGAEGAWGLLGVQLIGCLAICLWAGGLSAIFFIIARMAGVLRLSEQDEILGGDIHYFMPIDFVGQLEEFERPPSAASAAKKKAAEIEMELRSVVEGGTSDNEK